MNKKIILLICVPIYWVQQLMCGDFLPYQISHSTQQSFVLAQKAITEEMKNRLCTNGPRRNPFVISHSSVGTSNTETELSLDDTQPRLKRLKEDKPKDIRYESSDSSTTLKFESLIDAAQNESRSIEMDSDPETDLLTTEADLLTAETDLMTEEECVASNEFTQKKTKTEFECPYCSKGFSKPGMYSQHMKNEHNDDQPFKCTYPDCKYTSARNSDLKKHRQIHCEIEYRCRFCNFSTRYLSNLRVHVNQHTQTKEYTCDECEKSYLSINGLKNHKSLKHKDRSEWEHVCGKCGIRFAFSWNLKQHIKICKI